MPKGSQSFVAAVAAAALGVICSIIVWLILQPTRPTLPRYSYGQSPAPDYRAGGAECEAASIAILKPLARVRRHDTCAERLEDQRLNRDDLVQQTRAADAVQAASLSAYESNRLALGGIIVGFLTLSAAAYAAYYAKSAAEAAVDTLDHEKVVTRLQLKPEINITTVDVDGERSSLSPIVTFAVHNSGSLAARAFRAVAG